MEEQGSTIGSDHGTTANALIYRGLEHVRSSKREYPRNLEDIVNEFRQVIRAACKTTGTSTDELFSDERVGQLKQEMINSHDGEVAFDKAIFKALCGCFAGYVHQEGQENQIFVLQSRDRNTRDDDKFAVGFFRHANPGLDVIPTVQENVLCPGSSSRTSAGLEARSRTCRHAVYLFEQDDCHRWQPKDCFGTIEIRTNETNCAEFPTVDGIVDSVDLGFRHGSLAQLLLYSMERIVLDHAKNGIWNQHIPLAIIAGRTNVQGRKRARRTDRLRWVSGRLYCPEVCGSPFYYSVDGFGRFSAKGTVSDLESAEQAVRLFLDAILSGLKLAILTRDVRNSGTRPSPCPASGRYVNGGHQSVSFCASPIRGAAPVAHSSKEWNIHQADLFQGNHVNIDEILQQPRIRCVDFRSGAAVIGETKQRVLIKVSSTAVHNLLIEPSQVMFALGEVKTGDKKMVEEIGSVLYAAVYTSKVGLMTIMSDLSDHNYKALTPLADAKHLSALWSGFATLVKDVLLPMAEKGIIHPDIRPGYDMTFNVLYRLEGDGKTATCKLIDLESLVHFQIWEVPKIKGHPDRRFLPREFGWDATTYVWWQCVFVAFVWKKEIKANDVAGSDVNQSVILVLRSVLVRKTCNQPEWLVALCHHTDGVRIDAAAVVSTLTYLGGLF